VIKYLRVVLGWNKDFHHVPQDHVKVYLKKTSQ
jgi:hypothetical protein